MSLVKDKYEIQLPFGPPPVLPDVQKQLREYLLCPDRLPIHDYEQAQKYWPRKPNPRALYHCEPAPLGTTLKVERDPKTGKILHFREVAIENMGCTAKNSMSLQRAPGPPDQDIRGSNTNYPFWPGGFPELLSAITEDEVNSEVDFINNLLSVPPGFEKGVTFKADKRTPLKAEEVKELVPKEEETPSIKLETKEEEASFVNLMSIVQQEEDLIGLWQEEAKPHEKKAKENLSIQNLDIDVDNEAEGVIPMEDTIPVLKITETEPAQALRKTEWAEELNVMIPVTDFEKKVPVMAKKWKFELDTFQKQAILKMEEKAGHVFVAAHTSAGKTVVAEYAIALSQNHMTKTIYTSPIKALSNQKYRDFKSTFGDVGLITGDFQINQTAQCLIMTTEILRSMLYCGSEVVRDLEYVIFDEVHYINDQERGHVWEEVLILLPDHVTIVMLSATVPNTLQFAHWLGHTKKRKVYVISTLKRPVPLKHYLYTGSGGKTRDERFLIMGEDGKLMNEGYLKAKAAKEKTDTKQQKSQTGPAESGKKGRQQISPKTPYLSKGKPIITQKQEKTMWEAFIYHLKENDKLPVVAFTLSRNRCDQNSFSLRSTDLTTQKEKSFIHDFFKRCISNLKEADRRLPQVINLEDLLSRGIGVHHSGILPILKEIVEMLFQKGMVKLLFATETFAMGVNMPARTVVFDSIRKYDGSKMRTLMPAEYIQMAGRAGRRGLDKTGTVIIMCKVEVPELYELRNMMEGKPTQLVSKFRPTYSMILNLFRVKQISMESMLSHSFKEITHQNNQKKYEKQLKDVEEKLRNTFSESQKQAPHWKPLAEFYDLAKDYITTWQAVRSDILTHPQYVKLLVPGRVMLIRYKEHNNKFGLLLSVEEKNKKERQFKVLVLCNSENKLKGFDEIELSVQPQKKEEGKVSKCEDSLGPLWYQMLGIANKNKIFVPEGVGGHTVLTLSASDIVDVMNWRIKLDDDIGVVLRDWERRQIERFRNDPVGPICNQAIQTLTEFTQNIASGIMKFDIVSPTRDIHVRRIEILDDLKKLDILERKLNECTSANIANFEQLFEEVFRYKKLDDERAMIKYNQSYESMSLYPEFQNMVKVLHVLNYINASKILELKGRVACEMGNHELLITEMLLDNILNDKSPEEIAALLSCLVFQQKLKEEVEIENGFLKKGKKEIEATSQRIKQQETECRVSSDSIEEYNKLNFGLVDVVYEWAKGKPFSEIMEKTEVQEGIIVRCIQQLNETLRDAKNAVHMIGEPILKQKMQEASDAIKRDIVFAASLYTSEETQQRLPKEVDERLLPVGDE